MRSAVRSTPRYTLAVVATTASASVAAVAALWATDNTTDAEAHAQPSLSYKIEADLMDKIASKSYIQQRNPSPDKRPRGVPKAIRILAIDIPEMRQAFDGECRVDLKRVFPDGTAPSKVLYQRETNSSVEVLQKSLAKSVVRCRNAKSKRVGVEMLEASVAELNPHNLRKTHRFGNYWYDPGKFARPHVEEEPSPASPDDVEEHEKANDSNKNEPEVEMVLATEEDELEAPWNQYAWIEELKKRVSGHVYFVTPMERSSGFSRVIFGNVYKRTVPSSRKLYEWFLPRFFQNDPNGVDGEALRKNWASQKPHAVIAHGAAMQRVPGSMKLLSDCCREANVPLYIVHDPRAWGGNTHKDLSEALRDMRHTIKGRITANVLEEQGGAFARGRVVGQLETEGRWQAKELHRKTQQAIRDVNDEYLRGRDNNWSKLDAEALKARLVEHGVIVLSKTDVEMEQEAAREIEEQEGRRTWWQRAFGRRHQPRGVASEGTITVTDGMLQLSKEIVTSTEVGKRENDKAKEDDSCAANEAEESHESA